MQDQSESGRQTEGKQSQPAAYEAAGKASDGFARSIHFTFSTVGGFQVPSSMAFSAQ
jgi:hypothetical protein